MVQLLFLLALASIPVQLGKFFFFDFSYVLGIPIDYRAPAVYLSDILIIVYILAFTEKNFKNFHKIFKLRKNFIYSIFLLNSYLFAQALFFSVSKEISLYINLKTLEFSAFSLYASYSLSDKRIFGKLEKVITFSLVWQSLVVFGQFITQRSVGLAFLGERAFDSSTPGIAHAQIFGKFYLRAYGTFPHPNVTGAFFIIFIIILLAITKNHVSRLITATFSTLALLLTFSKSALFALVIAFLISYSQVKDLLLKVAAILILVFVAVQILPTIDVASFAERLTLAQAAFDIAKLNPVFGTGSGNFILELSKFDLFTISQVRLLQPVHNVFLLFLVENGIIGLLLLSFVLSTVFQNVVSKLKISLFIIILIYLSVDHFFATVQQGQILFWLALASILASPNRQIS